VYVYDLNGDGTWTSKSNMVKPRFYHRAVLVEDKIYVLGGRSQAPPADLENTVEMYDPLTDTWTLMANMPSSRALHTAEVFDGKIYVFGGSNLDNRDVEVYNPEINLWSVDSQMPESRLWHGSGVIGESIFIFGGGPTYSVMEFNPLENEWTIHADSDLPESIGWFGYAVAADEEGESCLYTFGGAYDDFYFGGSGPFVTDAVWKYNPVINSVKESKTKSIQEIESFPNPFQTSMAINYELKNAGFVSIDIFNSNGQKVRSLFEGHQPAGNHLVKWQPKGLDGGVYFYRLQTKNYYVTGKCILKN
ncbi:MAG: T9SS C-terminal target domain-containing protein, partial [Bacteroidetes bacterium]